MRANPLVKGEKSLIVVSLEELKASDRQWRVIMAWVAIGFFLAGLIMGVLIEAHF